MLKKRRDYQAYLYLVPALLLMAVFTIYPVINTMVTSFKEGYRFLTGDFIRFSFQNYIDILHDSVFRRAVMKLLSEKG